MSIITNFHHNSSAFSRIIEIHEILEEKQPEAISKTEQGKVSPYGRTFSLKGLLFLQHSPKSFQERKTQPSSLSSGGRNRISPSLTRSFKLTRNMAMTASGRLELLFEKKKKKKSFSVFRV